MPAVTPGLPDLCRDISGQWYQGRFALGRSTIDTRPVAAPRRVAGGTGAVEWFRDWRTGAVDRIPYRYENERKTLMVC